MIRSRVVLAWPEATEAWDATAPTGTLAAASTTPATTATANSLSVRMRGGRLGMGQVMWASGHRTGVLRSCACNPGRVLGVGQASPLYA